MKQDIVWYDLTLLRSDVMNTLPSRLLFNANWKKFQLYISWREQVNFQRDDDEVRFVLDQNTELDLNSAS
jgi:hypothetical protein